jgi:hypothetical protein
MISGEEDVVNTGSLEKLEVIEEKIKKHDA